MNSSYSQFAVTNLDSASSPSESVSAVPDRFRSGSTPLPGTSAVPESFRSTSAPVVSSAPSATPQDPAPPDPPAA